MQQLAIPGLHRVKLAWVNERSWLCPQCQRVTHMDSDRDETAAEIEADPLCCWCRPTTDPRLASRIIERRKRDAA